MHFVPDILWIGGKKKKTIENFKIVLNEEHEYNGVGLHLTNCGVLRIVYGDGHWVRLDLRDMTDALTSNPKEHKFRFRKNDKDYETNKYIDIRYEILVASKLDYAYIMEKVKKWAKVSVDSIYADQ